MELTSELARRFATAGVQVISTFSKGIDSAAHLATRSADGASFSVLDSGFDNLAGSELMPLAIDIVQSGGMVSEYAPEEKMSGDNMAQANRLVVGLSQAVVVTELYHDSHRTLDLLKFCNQIGKLLFLMVNPEWGALADEPGLRHATEWGAIPIEGHDHIDDIINALV
jgi:DNA processing protein